MTEPILDQINSPKDLKKLTDQQLFALCQEVRKFLVSSVSRTGGHLASNLGVVELTVMLHRLFDSPHDHIVFDVGHQSYTHKLLTGRKDAFSKLRKTDGLSGFPRPAESAHDAFIAGHASNSVSAALGIAQAARLKGDDSYTIAVIGDGALTGGEAYEALNNAGRSNTRLIVILNHNDMSISKNVGAFAKYLSSLRSSRRYLRMKRHVESVLLHTPLIGKPIHRWLRRSKSIVRRVVYPSTFFEDMGFHYLGPIDGHSLSDLSSALSRAKELAAPVVVQVETIKGKGYLSAEENPGEYHAVSPSASTGENYSEVAGRFLCELANQNDKICAITAAMKYGTGLQHFAAAHRERFFDVGIAEEHAVTFAGGLAANGMIPVFCVYSSFLQRGYDQVIHDLAIDNRHVVLCVDRAGLVGEDGETHQGVFDAAYLSQIPNMTLYSPEGYEELRLCLKQAVETETGLVAVRYPRGGENRAHTLSPDCNFQFVKDGMDTLLVSYGRSFSECVKAKAQAQSDASLLKLTRIAPIDHQAIKTAMAFRRILFVEEGIYTGSIAQQFSSMLLEQGYRGKMEILAIRGEFVAHGAVKDLLASLNLDADGIVKALKQEETPNE